jgi:hypothetical protein
VYLLILLAGFAAGLWPDAIRPPIYAGSPAPLPVLRTVGVAQAAFILLAHPILLARWGGLSGRGYALRSAAQAGLYLLAGAPLYFIGAWLGDATATDAVRLAVYVACLWPVGLVAGRWLATGSARSAVLAGLLVAALGLPAGWYIHAEFAPSWRAWWLWDLGPLTCAWKVARSRTGSPWPQPAWAWFIWPAIAATAGLVLAWTSRRRRAAAA